MQSHEFPLPPGLPVPQVDGACDHLPGMRLPDVVLRSTGGRHVMPARLPGRTIVYCYPMTGRPGVALPQGWDQIPGARGCTPESCGFRDRHHEILGRGAIVFGLSTQDTDYQREAAERLGLPFELLSDNRLEFTRALRLPTFDAGSGPLIKRLTLVIRGGVIEKVFNPVFPPDRHVEEVVAWLGSQDASHAGP